MTTRAVRPRRWLAVSRTVRVRGANRSPDGGFGWIGRSWWPSTRIGQCCGRAVMAGGSLGHRVSPSLHVAGEQRRRVHRSRFRDGTAGRRRVAGRKGAVVRPCARRRGVLGASSGSCPGGAIRAVPGLSPVARRVGDRADHSQGCQLERLDHAGRGTDGWDRADDLCRTVDRQRPLGARARASAAGEGDRPLRPVDTGRRRRRSCVRARRGVDVGALSGNRDDPPSPDHHPATACSPGWASSASSGRCQA